jgi:transposase
LSRFVARLEEKLTKLAKRAAEGKVRGKQKVERQIGRLLERNSRAASLFTVTVTEKDVRLSIAVKKNEERYQRALETGGNYILRTNWDEADPKILWNTDIQLTEVEDAFRTTKHDLGMRPIFHQKKDRTQAHILVCFLSLALWRTLQQWMKMSGLGTPPRKLLEEMRKIKSLDCPTCKGQNHQVEGGGHRPTGTQGVATEDANLTSQQTKNNRKCSAENCPLFGVTNCNHSF